MNQEQENNLRTLAHYLMYGELKSEFNMADFDDLIEGEYRSNCGTVGCAAGHGPYAGIPKRNTENWYAYTKRAFGANPWMPPGTDGDEWGWLFSCEWKFCDNRPFGAGLRILFFLENGVPGDFAIPQKRWVDLYTDWWQAEADRE